jgi:hypothetical protein
MKAIVQDRYGHLNALRTTVSEACAMLMMRLVLCAARQDAAVVPRGADDQWP